MKAIADTGVLVAFGSRTDTHHEWAVHLARQNVEPWITCEAVLAETAFHLGDSQLALDFVRDGLVRPVFNLAENIEQMAELSKRFKDRRPDLADLCLIRLSELFPKYPVITTDVADFRVYRRNRREAIPIVFPPSGFGKDRRNKKRVN